MLLAVVRRSISPRHSARAARSKYRAVPVDRKKERRFGVSLLPGLAWLHACVWCAKLSRARRRANERDALSHVRGKRFDAFLQLLHRQLLLLHHREKKSQGDGRWLSGRHANLVGLDLHRINPDTTHYVDSHQLIVDESLPAP